MKKLSVMLIACMSSLFVTSSFAQEERAKDPVNSMQPEMGRDTIPGSRRNNSDSLKQRRNWDRRPVDSVRGNRNWNRKSGDSMRNNRSSNRNGDSLRRGNWNTTDSTSRGSQWNREIQNAASDTLGGTYRKAQDTRLRPSVGQPATAPVTPQSAGQNNLQNGSSTNPAKTSESQGTGSSSSSGNSSKK